MLEVARQVPSVRVVVVATSDKCYENRELDHAYREDDAMGGHDPYSSSKGAAELVTAAYARSFFETGASRCRVASVRAGNVIGGGDWAEDRLMADLMRGPMAGEPIAIRNPDAVRPWQHVLDPLAGYLRLAEALTARPETAGGWNFGPPTEDAKPVSWLADRIGALWPEDLRWEVDPGPHPTRPISSPSIRPRPASSSDGRRSADLDDALESIVAWYTARRTGQDVRRTTIAQIDSLAGDPSTLPRR